MFFNCYEFEIHLSTFYYRIKLIIFYFISILVKETKIPKNELLIKELEIFNSSYLFPVIYIYTSPWGKSRLFKRRQIKPTHIFIKVSTKKNIWLIVPL